MCDYSLHDVASRPAKVGDKLISTHFPNAITRGFCGPKPAARRGLYVARDGACVRKRSRVRRVVQVPANPGRSSPQGCALSTGQS